MAVIDIANLRQSVDQIFAHIQDRGLSQIELTEQHYWLVDPSKKYVMNSEPTELVVGDLVSDLDVAKSLASPTSDALAYHLALIGPLLTYVGEEAAKRLAPQGG